MPTAIEHKAAKKFTAHQKAGVVVILLVEGGKLTTAEIASLTRTTWAGASYMMDALSIVLPLVQIDSKWQWIEQL